MKLVPKSTKPKVKRIREYQIIDANGSIRLVHQEKPASLEQLQRWVGGYIQGCWIDKRYCYVDEDGISKGLNQNALHPEVLGNIVMCPKGCRT